MHPVTKQRDDAMGMVIVSLLLLILPLGINNLVVPLVKPDVARELCIKQGVGQCQIEELNFIVGSRSTLVWSWARVTMSTLRKALQPIFFQLTKQKISYRSAGWRGGNGCWTPSPVDRSSWPEQSCCTIGQT